MVQNLIEMLIGNVLTNLEHIPYINWQVQDLKLPLNDILMKFFNLNEKIKGEETRGQKNLSEYINKYHKEISYKIELTLFLFIICHRTGHLV